MSLSILDGRSNFWQWDTNQQLLVEDTACGQVHYCNGTSDCALVAKIETLEDGRRVAAVPNILLQSSDMIMAYLYQVDEYGARTRKDYRFRVLPRNRPADYVYTEDDVFSYADLEDRVTDLEKNLEKQVAASVSKYLEENPPSGGGGVDFKTDATLKLENGILSVNTTNQMEQDNTLPITSAGVFATVGNIEVLLKTI